MHSRGSSSSRAPPPPQLIDSNLDTAGSDTGESFEETLWPDGDLAVHTGAPASTSSTYRYMEEATNETVQVLRSRPLVQRRSVSASLVPPVSSAEHHPPSQATFESPLRSIIVSSPPTSSISANTALASLSTAPNSGSTNTFAALASAGARRAPLKPSDSAPAIPLAGTSTHPMIRTEKDLDDPDAAPIGSADYDRSLSTAASLTRLFAVDESSSPGRISRDLSHLRTLSGAARNLQDTSSLTGHLFHNGFLEGRHSDITIHVFGEAYRLHKLLLDRVPFFSSAFSGGWLESSSDQMVLHPEDMDSNITKTAFELAIKRVYGTPLHVHEEQIATSLFATACWLNMPDLIESCVDNILQQMRGPNLHELIKLVTNNYYGKAGDRILASAKAMLCHEGFEMPHHAWDKIPAEITREIVGGDAFFVPSEWERWFLATKILNRRLKFKAIEAGLVTEDGQLLYPKPSSLRFFAVRFDTIYRRESGLSSARHVAEKDEPWVSLYTSPEIAPILVLLDEGIHYVHLRFEQLQQIRLHRDVLGVLLLQEKVISDALWLSMELRQKVLNAHENDLELGLSQSVDDQEDDQDKRAPPPVSRSSKGKELAVESEDEIQDASVESDSWDGTGRPRKFWIPSNDVSLIMGGTREANISGSITGVEWNAHAARLSASLEPSDVPWATDFVLPLGQSITNPAPARYSTVPPFRFACELPNPRTLKEKKRVYSHTVFYLGSLWNVYIQRVHTSKHQQLGVYLHRAKESAPSDDPQAQVVPASVDDRIGQLEREMLLRKSERHRRAWRDSDGNAAGGSSFARHSTSNLDERIFMGDSQMAQKDEGPEHIRSTLTSPELGQRGSKSGAGSSSKLRDSDAEDEELLRANRRHNVPAMPPYLDTRPVIKTYFKIYSPDKNGRLLSIYESAPEKFVVSKSWGWKSSQTGYDDAGGNGYDMGRGSGKLRYMVVIGNV